MSSRQYKSGPPCRSLCLVRWSNRRNKGLYIRKPCHVAVWGGQRHTHDISAHTIISWATPGEVSKLANVGSYAISLPGWLGKAFSIRNHITLRSTTVMIGVVETGLLKRLVGLDVSTAQNSTHTCICACNINDDHFYALS